MMGRETSTQNRISLPQAGPRRMHDYAARLPRTGRALKEAVARGLGYQRWSGLAPLAVTGRVLGFTEEDGSQVWLSPRGRRFKEGGVSAQIAAREATMGEGPFGKTAVRLSDVLCGQPLDGSHVRDALVTLGFDTREASLRADIVVEWLALGGASPGQDGAAVLGPATAPPYEEMLLDRLDEIVYSNLVSYQFADRESPDPRSYHRLVADLCALSARPAADPDQAMRRLVECAVPAFGYSVMVRNGPREAAGRAKFRYGKPTSSDIFDDAVAWCVPPAHRCLVFALGIEAKNGPVDRKGANQAASLARRLRQRWGTPYVVPVALSTVGRYENRGARDEGQSAGVVCLSLEALREALGLQVARFTGGETVLTPVAVHAGLLGLVKNDNLEPSTQDFLDALNLSMAIPGPAS